jgi:hypothetical protein
MASRALKIDPKGPKHEATTASGTAQSEPAQGVSPEEVAARSYELWQERGCPAGSPEVDWFRAEDELRERSSKLQSAA